MGKLWAKFFVFCFAHILSTSYIAVIIWNWDCYGEYKWAPGVGIVVWALIFYWYIGKDIDDAINESIRLRHDRSRTSEAGCESDIG